MASDKVRAQQASADLPLRRRPHLREFAISKPLQPPHAVVGLPLASGTPRHHDARPPGKALDLAPHQLSNSKTLAILDGGGRTVVRDLNGER